MRRADAWKYHTLPTKASCKVYGNLKRMSVEEFNKREEENKVKHYAYPKKRVRVDAVE